MRKLAISLAILFMAGSVLAQNFGIIPLTITNCSEGNKVQALSTAKINGTIEDVIINFYATTQANSATVEIVVTNAYTTYSYQLYKATISTNSKASPRRRPDDTTGTTLTNVWYEKFIMQDAQIIFNCTNSTLTNQTIRAFIIYAR